MKKIDYSDATPDVVITAHDSDGQPTTILDAAGTHTLTYDLLGQIESESIAGGILAGVNLNPEYTTAGVKGRLKEWNLTGSGGLALQHTYGYETGTDRLKTVSDGASTATYDYLGSSDWLNTTTVAYNGTTALVTTRTPDTANRLASIVSTRGAQTIESHAWTYDPVTGQRTRDTLADNKYWQYGYNGRGEVESGVKKQADDNTQPGYGYGYSYDSIGNRLATTTNGRTAAYVPNSLNQYNQRDVAGAVDVTGEIEGANAQVQVSAGGGPKVWATRTGTAFNAVVPVDNSQSAQYPALYCRAILPRIKISENDMDK